jgi:hypothetical protein
LEPWRQLFTPLLSQQDVAVEVTPVEEAAMPVGDKIVPVEETPVEQLEDEAEVRPQHAITAMYMATMDIQG